MVRCYTIIRKIKLRYKKLPWTRWDSASNMSSEAVGVQKQIKKLCEEAVYTHYCGHNLNLVIATDCKNPIIQNTLDI